MREPQRPGRASLAGRLLTWYAVLFIALIGLFGGLVVSEMRDVLVEEEVERLTRDGRLIAGELGGEMPLQERVVAMGEVSGLQITVFDGNGAVLADSHTDPVAVGASTARPELQAALEGELGVALRASDASDGDRLYVALPPGGDGRVVRVSVSEEQISEDVADVTARIVGTALVAGAAGVVVIALVARWTTRPIRELTEAAASVAEGELATRPRRSNVAELDRLGLAIGRIASELGRRILESEDERRTLQVVLGALPQGVLLIDEDDSIPYANPAAEAILGEAPDRLRGLSPPSLQRLVRRARPGDHTVDLALEHGAPTRHLRAVATPFEGEDERVLLVLIDVTERQRVEQMRRDFVADASHELKTPVSSILASVETLQMALERDSERARQFADQVETSARQLARMVEDLLDLSRLEASEVLEEPTRLDEVVGDEVARMQLRAEEAGISLSVETEPVEVMGSPADLALAVRNLCDNALRYTDPGGQVEVRVRRLDGSAVVEVADTGAGIPTRALPRVFERFYRVDVARSRATGGTGLGLAIVKHVAERHGGRVSVESELGVGSTFRIELPVLEASEIGERR